MTNDRCTQVPQVASKVLIVPPSYSSAGLSGLSRLEGGTKYYTVWGVSNTCAVLCRSLSRFFFDLTNFKLKTTALEFCLFSVVVLLRTCTHAFLALKEGGGVMHGRSSGKTAPPVPGLTRVGGGAINAQGTPTKSNLALVWCTPGWGRNS